VEQARQLYLLPENEFLRWSRRNLTPEVRKRLGATPGRDPAETIANIYSWDACIALLTALRGQMHLPTRRRVIYNCGIDGAHFGQDDADRGQRFREPPFNMIAFEEVWSYFEEG
jgi:hypothetical protein